MSFSPFFLLLLLVCAFGRLDRIFLKENGSFSPKFVLPNWDRCPQIETPAFEGACLHQPFTYLTKGKQSFVFVSQDGKWVLKLLRLPHYVRRFSLKGRPSSLEFFAKTLEGCRLAQTVLGDETQVVYSHLQPTHCFQRSLSLIDRFGRGHKIPLDTLPFVVQRLGEDYFSTLAQSPYPKDLIDKTLALFRALYAKKIIDHDAILDKNFGTYENTPFIIDIGQLEQVEQLPSEEEYLWAMTHSLRLKLQNESDPLYHYYEKALRRNK